MLSFYLQKKLKTIKTSKHTISIYEDRDLTHFTVKETGATVAVNSKEHPAINITEDGLLECRYHPYKTRKDKIKSRQRTYLVTKKGHPVDHISC